MTERLIIRLASKASQRNNWLIWSDNENEIIASGEVESAEQLNLLTEKAQQRTVICLLPNVDVCIRDIAINGTFNRQMQQALPYLLEDELACDVEKLHFSLIAKQTDLIHVAICDKQKIINWLSWLEEAQISCSQFIPEGLVLPVAEDGKWQAVQLDKQWIVRESEFIAWSCEAEMLPLILDSKIEADITVDIESYSCSPENTPGSWFDVSPTLPMELLAKGTDNNKINVLSGEFKVKKARNNKFNKWRMPLILTALIFLLLMLNLYQKTRQVEKQTLLVQHHVETVYKQAFSLKNTLKYSRVKKKVKTMLAGLGENSESGFLSMFNEVLPAFVKNPQLKPSNIKFDSKKQEMRILVSGDNFQSFEKFSASLPKQFSVEQGALNNSNAHVSGLLTIRVK